MDDFEKYLNKAFHFLSYRPRSEKEIRDKLLQMSARGRSASGGKKAPQEIIERVIAALKENKFINDEDYARWFIENRLRFNPKGQRILKMELKQKGIDRDVIDQAIDNLSKDQEGEVPSSDLESAQLIVEKKMSKFKDMEKHEIYQKLGAFLARRGFSWDIIKKSIDSELSRS